MRRRTFLRLSVGSASAGVLRRIHAQPPRTQGVKAKVVIVGGGFAGASCALILRHVSPDLDVVLADPEDPYVTCPMSNSVLVGLRDLKSISVSRRGLERAGIRCVRDSVDSIDPQRRRVHLAGGAELAYDRLVLAPGIRLLWGKPQGYDLSASRVMPHAWQAGAQTEILAAQLRAMPDGGVVAISVPPGPMRCPPGPFERASLIAGYLRQSKPRSKVLIFDSNNRFPRQDAFSDAWNSLYPGMIEWIPVVADGAVVRVEPAKRVLYTSHGTHRVAVANIIPQQAPGLLAAQAGLASDHGWCPIKPQTFESQLIAHIHVIGDACIADPMPKAASAAHAQAKQCALAIAAALEGREPPPPEFESVCYSMLARGVALSVHGRFRLTDGTIEQIPAAEDAGSVRPEQEARNAEDWYAGIVAGSFGV
ncbi:MAG TPA: FAD-dependent oxidoreductase [Steroidobacteraceae bacterium]|nr:FAD-dependent oxidoreductase [Steroidobacteraceae bacterium]